MDDSSYFLKAQYSQGSIVLLQGCEAKSAEKSQLLERLRRGLAERGWNTLVLPVAEAPKNEDFSRYLHSVASIEARSYLPPPLTLLLHGCDNPYLLMNNVSQETSSPFSSIVSLVLPAEVASQLLDKTNVPFLNIESDSESLSKTSSLWLSFLEKKGGKYLMIPQVDRFFSGYEHSLILSIVNWLKMTK